MGWIFHYLLTTNQVEPAVKIQFSLISSLPLFINHQRMKLALALLVCIFFSCTNNNNNNNTTGKKKHVSPCGCLLSDEQELNTCPIKAVGDSVVICKIGTNTVLGDGGGTMNWPEYMASKFFGGEGPLVDCETGKPLFNGSYTSPVLTYKGNKIIVDKRLPFEIYDPTSRQWMDQIELPVWRNKITARNGKLIVSPDSLIFRPPFHDRQAFASADSAYKAEMSRTDHYLYLRTVNRLLACALSGDTLSERRLQNFEADIADYFTRHPESRKYLTEKMLVFSTYKDYLKRGGKRTYFDLSIFPYFYEQMKKRNKNQPPPRTSLKPLDE